jgi:methyl-accepting chemotaxis protein PixJ
MTIDSRSKVDTKVSDRNGKLADANGVVQVIEDSRKLPLVGATQSKNPIGRWWEGLSLLTKSAVVSVIAISVPLIAIGGFSYYYVGQNIVSSTKVAKSARAQGMGYRVAYFMRERYGDIQTLAKLSFLTNSKVLAVTTPQERQAVLNDYVKIYTVYDSIAAFDLNGDVITQSQGATLNNHKDRTYFQTVLKTDAPVIDPPEVSKSTGKIVIHIAAPIKDLVTGKTTGVIRSRMPIENLENLISDFTAGGEQYHVAGADGKFFVTLEKELIGRDLKTDFPTFVSAVDKREIASGSSFDGVTKAEQLVGYSPMAKVEGLPDLGWNMVLATNSEDALRPLQQLLLVLISATGAMVVLATVLAISITRRAARPILDATKAVAELGRGNLNTRLAVKGQDELAQLGGNINSMAGQLQNILAVQSSEVRLSETQNKISQLTATDQFKTLIEAYMNEVRVTFGCNRVVVYEFDAEYKGRITQEVIEKGWTSAYDANLSDPCIPKELIDGYQNGRVVSTGDVMNAGFAPKHLDLMRKLEIKSNLVAPIRREGQLYGLLIAHHCQEQHSWRDDEVAYLKQAGEQLGRALRGMELAIEKQTVEAQERERAATLQTELLGLLGDVEGATEGDLTVRAQISAGEIGIVADFFNAIVESLRDVVTQVKQATAKVNTSVTSDNESIRSLAFEANAQSEQLEDALKSVGTMTASIQQVALNAQQASEASSSAASTAQEGSTAIEQSVESILQLRQNVADTAKKVKRLGEASQQISKVVALIDQIALKTNMLAVNASIEAARAGEEGRGFAVVAEEVGALAAQSATATKEIARIVETIQQETSEVVEAMEASTLQVVEGTNKVEDARKSLGKIVEVSQRVNQLFQGISTATVSQVKTSQSVQTIMESLSKQSQQSSKTSREVAESLQETVSVANQLQSSVETFKV